MSKEIEKYLQRLLVLLASASLVVFTATGKTVALMTHGTRKVAVGIIIIPEKEVWTVRCWAVRVFFWMFRRLLRVAHLLVFGNFLRAQKLPTIRRNDFFLAHWTPEADLRSDHLRP